MTKKNNDVWLDIYVEGANDPISVRLEEATFRKTAGKLVEIVHVSGTDRVHYLNVDKVTAIIERMDK